MRRLICILRGPAACAVLIGLAALLQATSAARAAAAGGFGGYTAPVRLQAERVVATAGPGQEQALEKELRALRKLMYAHGILSLNAVPDLIYERSVREGWRHRSAESVRAATAVAPLSASAWALVVRDDIAGARMDRLPRDFAGLAGAVRQFAPGLLGFGAWLASYLSAAACWFVAWGAIAVFLRARPSLESDIGRLAPLPPRDAVSVLLTAAMFLLPLLGGQGLAVSACFWLVLSAGYLRRGDLLIASVAVALLAALLAGGEVARSLGRAGSDARRVAWLGAEGYLRGEAAAAPSAWQPGPAGSSASWMARFGRARGAMIGGDAAASERIWTDLIGEGHSLPEFYNNRGVSLAMQGRTAEALADFETALAKRPRDGPALWNAYQVYLQTFNLERARVIQPVAWDSLRKMSPYYFRPAEMEAGEWVGSPLPAAAVWGALLERAPAAAGGGGGGDVFQALFRPLKPSGAVAFLAMAVIAGALWKVLSIRIWVHSTCRCCGERTLVAGARESQDLCNACRGQAGGSVRGLPGRSRRAEWIAMHRRYVRLCSILVPGSGSLWAGKDVRTLLFGVILALALAGVSASWGGGEGGAIVTDLRRSIAFAAAAVSACVWLAGAVWGIRSFERFQGRYNAGSRRV